MPTPEQDPTPEDEPETVSDEELARLKAENARLRAELEETEHAAAPPTRRRWRGVAVFVLMALAATTFAGAMVGIWARRTVFNDAVFAARASAIAADPAVQTAVATYMTDQLMTVVNPQALFEEVLPERGKLLAPVLSNAVRGFVNDQVYAFIRSDAFAQLWARVVANAHTALVRLLRGESQIVSTQGDSLVINLIPVINAALAKIGEISPDLFGRTIDIPTLTADDVPEAAQQRISAALGKQLSPSFGIIEIPGGGEQLQAAQNAVRVFDLLVYALVILTLLLVPLTLWLSTRRRTTLMKLALATAVAIVIIRRMALGLQSDLLTRVTNPANTGAASSISKILIDPLLDATVVVLWALVAVVALAWITGPYRSAVWLRGLVGAVFAGVSNMTGDSAAQPGAAAAIAWARDHVAILQAAGAVVAVLILLVTDLSWLGTFLLAVLLGAWVLGLSRLSSGATAGPTTPTAATPAV